MQDSAGMSKSQWKKIYDFSRRMPTNIEHEVGGIKLLTSEGRSVHYTYRQLFLCLCTEACIQRETYLILAPIHFLQNDARVSISYSAVMQLVNQAYKAYQPYLPKQNYYIDKKTGDKILIHTWA